MSSGDAGSHPDNTGHNSDGPLQAEYEASDTAVIGVGGTSLTLNNSGGVVNETGWIGSGGGISIFFDRPAWQTGNGVPAGDKRSSRSEPCGGPEHRCSGLFPRWSTTVRRNQLECTDVRRLIRAMNSARTKANKQSLGFLNPLIYPLIGTSSFRDITAGLNGPTCNQRWTRI